MTTIEPQVQEPVTDGGGEGTTDMSGVSSALAAALAKANVSHPVVAETEQLLRRARDMGIAVAQLRGQHTSRRTTAIAALLDGSMDMDAGIAAVLAEQEWVRPFGGTAAVDGVFKEVQRLAQLRAQAALALAGGDIWGRLALAAEECVAQVSDVAPIPAVLLRTGAGAAANEAVRIGYGDAWRVHLVASDRFGFIHEAAGILRRHVGGIGGADYPDGAPNAVAQAYRAWWKWFEQGQGALEGQHQRRAVPPTLRLRWAAVNGWEPGLWLPHQIRRAPVQQRNRWRDGMVKVFGGPKPAGGK